MNSLGFETDKQPVSFRVTSQVSNKKFQYSEYGWKKRETVVIVLGLLSWTGGFATSLVAEEATQGACATRSRFIIAAARSLLHGDDDDDVNAALYSRSQKTGNFHDLYPSLGWCGSVTNANAFQKLRATRNQPLRLVTKRRIWKLNTIFTSNDRYPFFETKTNVGQNPL